jgi:hypothetical protein
MRGKLAILGMCTAVIVALPIRAAEKPPESFQKAMQDIGASNAEVRKDAKTIEGSGAYPDYTLLDNDIARLRPAFITVLAFWTEKKQDDAVKLAQTALKAVEDLEKAGKEKNYDSLMLAVNALGGTCGPCHTAHRERKEDGSFEIK